MVSPDPEQLGIFSPQQRRQAIRKFQATGYCHVSPSMCLRCVCVCVLSDCRVEPSVTHKALWSSEEAGYHCLSLSRSPVSTVPLYLASNPSSIILPTISSTHLFISPSFNDSLCPTLPHGLLFLPLMSQIQI